MPTRNDGAADDPIRRAAEGDGFPTIALGALIISTALALLGLALTAVARPPWGIGQWFYAADTVDAVVYAVVAWLLLTDRTRLLSGSPCPLPFHPRGLPPTHTTHT